MASSEILDVAIRLGARLKRVGANEYVGPCPVCDGRDRFGINVAKRVFVCRVCAKGGDAIELVRHVLGVGYSDALAFVGDDRAQPPRGGRRQAPTIAPNEHSSDSEKSAHALALWRNGVDPRGTIVERYLNGRGLALDDDLANEVIRFHPALGWREIDGGPVTRVPAMIAAMRRIDSNEIVAISARRLTPLGEKVGKPMFRARSKAPRSSSAR